MFYFILIIYSTQSNYPSLKRVNKIEQLDYCSR